MRLKDRNGFVYLHLQLGDGGCEIKHQFGDVLQLGLQELDGVGLLLVLFRKHQQLVSSGLNVDLFLLSGCDLLSGDAGCVLQFGDGLVESSLHLLHLLTIPSKHQRKHLST